MKLPDRRQFLHLAAGAAVLAVFSVATNDHLQSQAVATKILVTFPKNSGGDLMTRAVADQISRSHGSRMIVENQGNPAGIEAIARAAPDGNSLLVINNDFNANSHFRKLAYDPLTDLEPVCKLGIAQALVVISNSSPYRTLGELINAAQERAGAITMVSNAGTVPHMGMEELKRAANVNMTFVPVRGGTTVLGVNAALAAVLNGQATWSIQTYQNSLEHMKAGRLRALATSSRKRLEALPELPTIAEPGYKDFDLDYWSGLFAPAKTSKEKISELSAWFRAALQQTEVQAKLAAEAYLPDAICGADFVAHIHKQHDEYGRLIRVANIKVE
jgi:tripartite-type tricarboxylate transporter receptor subunit TctC